VAFNKKGKRKITVDGNEFYWSVTGGDDVIGLVIMTDFPSSPRLSCAFDYRHIPIEKSVSGHNFTLLTNQFIITPYTVQEVIKYALSIGWSPFEEGKDLQLGFIDDKVNLRLEENRIDYLKESIK
jgi:hypothetical protein